MVSPVERFHCSLIPVRKSPEKVFTPPSSKEFLDIQETTECGFTVQRAREMIRTYSPEKGL